MQSQRKWNIWNPVRRKSASEGWVSNASSTGTHSCRLTLFSAAWYALLSWVSVKLSVEGGAILSANAVKNERESINLVESFKTNEGFDPLNRYSPSIPILWAAVISFSQSWTVYCPRIPTTTWAKTLLPSARFSRSEVEVEFKAAAATRLAESKRVVKDKKNLMIRMRWFGWKKRLEESNRTSPLLKYSSSSGWINSRRSRNLRLTLSSSCQYSKAALQWRLRA